MPTDLGGAGLDLAQINRLQRRIAYVAPATAVGINMHHYWTGLCADLHRAGDPSGDWVLARAMEGHVERLAQAVRLALGALTGASSRMARRRSSASRSASVPRGGRRNPV